MNKKIILNTNYVENENISFLTTIKTQGNICGAFYPLNERELKNIYLFLKENRLPFIIVGNGSNLLISDKAKLYVISTKKMKQNIKIKNNDLYVSASTPLAKVFQHTYKHNLSGFEELNGIPATIGGAIKMNASAFGRSVFDNLEYVKVFVNGKIIKLRKENIEYSHHKTNLSNCLILSAKFNLRKEKYYNIKNTLSNCIIKRNASQPKGLSCGSVFKNPPHYFAGKLIEECGLKGLKIGGGEISSTHANFILNTSNATFNDIKRLIIICQDAVKNRFGIDLECEVEIIE